MPPFADPLSSPPFTLVSVSPSLDDHGILGDNLASRTRQLCPRWKFVTTPTLAGGVAAAGTQGVGVVVCERDLFPGSWRDMLDGLQALPLPPLLIVTSHLADEHLWAEALNLGAYDVLAKPFEDQELTRVLHSALVHWQERSRRRSAAAR
jgi:DNA-binding response OmpR family regulator